MDLSWHERRDLSEALVAYYARETCDYDLYALLDFYQSYRAYVRGKVSSIMEQGAQNEEARARANAQARRYYLLSEACTREPLEPARLFAVGGYIAAGKSSVADELGRLLSAPVISSDRLRKKLAGVQATQPLRDAAFSGEYAPQKTRDVYAELLRLGEVVLASGRSVVLDASFREYGQRDALRALAARRGVALRFVECWVPEEVILARLAERAKGPSISDGRREVFEAFRQGYEALRDGEGVRLDTSGDLGNLAATLTEFARA